MMLVEDSSTKGEKGRLLRIQRKGPLRIVRIPLFGCPRLATIAEEIQVKHLIDRGHPISEPTNQYPI